MIKPVDYLGELFDEYGKNPENYEINEKISIALKNLHQPYDILDVYNKIGKEKNLEKFSKTIAHKLEALLLYYS